VGECGFLAQPCYDPDVVTSQSAPLTVRIPPELRLRFKIVCAKQERTMNDVLSEFIAWYTQRKEKEGD